MTQLLIFFYYEPTLRSSLCFIVILTYAASVLLKSSTCVIELVLLYHLLNSTDWTADTYSVKILVDLNF